LAGQCFSNLVAMQRICFFPFFLILRSSYTFPSMLSELYAVVSFFLYEAESACSMCFHAPPGNSVRSPLPRGFLFQPFLYHLVSSSFYGWHRVSPFSLLATDEFRFPFVQPLQMLGLFSCSLPEGPFFSFHMASLFFLIKVWVFS